MPAGPGSLTALEAALEALALTPDDLALPVHLQPPDPWRLSLVEALLRRPLDTVSVVRGLGLRLAAVPASLAEQIRMGAEALGVSLVHGDPAPAASLEVLLLEARRALGRPVSPRQAARTARAVASLPEGVRDGAARILAAQRQALEILRGATTGLSASDAVELLAWGRAQLAQPGSLPGIGDPDNPVHRRALALAARIDRGAMFRAAWIVADAVDRALPDLIRGSRDPGVPRAAGALLLNEPTPWGRVVIAGAGPNRHDQDAFLLIDLGGDDEYTNNAGGTAGRLGAVAVAIDLGGNDRYRTTRDMVQGAGVLGIGILVDVAGDDTYNAGSFAQGAGLFGVGLLADRGGDDRYSAGAMAQGAGAFGLGVLVDGAGGDRYHAATMAQGFGFVAGMGALLDLGGDDEYILAGGHHDPRQPEHTQSLGQGMGLGLRPHAAGGIGLLVDGAGNDTYRADYFAQGVGFWFALGGLVDQTGDDSYRATRYAQGVGLHLAVGVLADGAGADVYEAHGVAQGVGHDWAVGILQDAEGNDRYHVVSLGQGAGSSNGVGLLVDVRGRDTLGVAGPTVQGCGIPSRGYPSIGLLLTEEASVLGLPVIDGRATRRCGDLGLTFSAAGLPAGVPWDPVPFPAAGVASPPAAPPAATAPPPWPPRSERLVALLRQAADPAESAEAEARRRAARRALLGDPGSLEVLLAALHREDPGTVSAALDLLVAMGAPAAKPVADLLDRRDIRVRRRAAWVLKGVAQPEVRSRLLEAARGDADPVVRGFALEGLRRWVAEDEARAVLLAAIGRESEWVARLGAARGLEGTDDAEALTALAAALGDAHFGVRAAARGALAAAGAAARPVLEQIVGAAKAPAPPLVAIARRHAHALLQRLDEGVR